MKCRLVCPHCGKTVERYRNPFPAVDIIIEIGSGLFHGEKKRGIVLIRRKNPPFGWALPGGFVDYGESLESAAVREAEEETCLRVKLRYQLGAYSDPGRDPRSHTISVVFVAEATGRPTAGDDAKEVDIFNPQHLPEDLAFDHRTIIDDYLRKCSQKK